MSRKERMHLPGGFYYIHLHRPPPQLPYFTHLRHYGMFEVAFERAVRMCDVEVQGYRWGERDIEVVVKVKKTPVGELVHETLHQFACVNPQEKSARHSSRSPQAVVLFNPKDHLLKILKNLHLKPVDEGRPEDYLWSSYRAWLGEDRVRWLTTRTGLSYLSPRIDLARAAYGSFMATALVPGELESLTSCSGMYVLGDSEFLQTLPPHWRVRRSTMSLEDIVEEVVALFGFKPNPEQIAAALSGKDEVLIRSVITWQAIERQVVVFEQAAKRLDRSGSTLFKGIERKIKLHPDLFRLKAIRERPAPISARLEECG